MRWPSFCVPWISGPGDEVLVPAVSAAATAMAVTLAGGRPVFVDVATSDFCMDPACAAERTTGRTRALVAVHLYGMPARVQELRRIGLPIIEDAAQAHGSDTPIAAHWAPPRPSAFIPPKTSERSETAE